MSIQIRDFKEPDRKQLKALWETCGLSKSYNDPDKDIDDFLRFGNARVLVALEGDKVVGSTCVCHDAHRGFVYYVATDPAYRGLGIATELMQIAENWIKELGLIKIQLFVRDTNAAVKDFYFAQGFKQHDVSLLHKFF